MKYGTVSAAPQATFMTPSREMPGRAVLRRDHRVRTGPVGDAQAGAEIVRIGHAVEHEQQRRLGQAHRAGRRAIPIAARAARPRATTP